jgi:hypothetical protein
MTTATMLAVFEDFNEPRNEALAPAAEDPSFAADEVAKIREAAWIDGYMTGRRAGGGQSNDQTSAARLLTSVFDLEARASGEVEAAALMVADLLINSVMAVTSEQWSAGLSQRVQTVVDHIRPALTVAPEFVLHEAGGTLRRFGDISEFSRALDEADIDPDVSIRWQRGAALISREAILEDLREAMAPLSAGLKTEPFTRQQHP